MTYIDANIDILRLCTLLEILDEITTNSEGTAESRLEKVDALVASMKPLVSSIHDFLADEESLMNVFSALPSDEKPKIIKQMLFIIKNESK